MDPRHAAIRLLVGTGVTDLTFRTSQVALPLVVLGATGSAGATGLVAGAAGLPVLLSPWWTRTLRHRLRSGRAIAGCYLVEALALSVVALAATVGHVTAWLLVTAGLTLGCAEALDGPARDALVADLGDQVGPDRALVWLTTRDFFRRASMIAGPAAGGFLVARGLAVPLLWAEVVSIVLSAALAGGVGRTGVALDPERVEGIWRTVVGHPSVLAGWVVRGTGCALWFGFTLGLALLGASQGRGGNLLAVGMTAYGAGSLLGTLGVIRLLRRVPVLPAIAGAWCLTGICWAAMGLVPTVPVIAAASVVSGLAVVVGNTGVTAAITRSCDGAQRRTLMAGQSVVVNAASSLGLLVGGPVLARWGAPATLRATGLVVACVALGSLALFRRSGEALGDLRRPPAVPTTELAGVHQQRVQLVQAHPVGPAVGERGDLLVGLQDPWQMRQAEEREHGQVGLAVAAVGGRVDHAASRVVGPDDVAVPEVAVQPARSLLGDEVGEPPDDRLDHLGTFGRDGAAVARELEVGQHALGGVELRPRRGALVRQRQPADVAVAVQAVRRRTGLVGRGQRPAEVARGLGRELAGLDPVEDQAVGLDREHLGHLHPAGLPEPPQAGRLGLEEPGWGIGQGLHEGRAPAAEPELGGGGDVAARDRSRGRDRGAQQLLGPAGDVRLTRHRDLLGVWLGSP
jgi:hypothetical protein